MLASVSPAHLVWAGRKGGGGKLGENLAGYLQIKQGTPRRTEKRETKKKKIGSIIPSYTWNGLMISVVGRKGSDT